MGRKILRINAGPVADQENPKPRPLHSTLFPSPHVGKKFQAPRTESGYTPKT